LYRGPVKLPEPGMQGDYHEACVICMRGTDSGMAFVGPAEMVVAALSVLGVPDDEAALTAAAAWGTPPGTGPHGEFTTVLRVCQDCAKSSPFKVGLLVGPTLPTYRW